MTPLRGWQLRRWGATLVVAALAVLLVGVPTDLVDTPFFDRDVPATWWSWPVLVASALLTGLLAATYVRAPTSPQDDGPSQLAGGIGGVLTFFAVGCPVCNKLVLLAVGTSGALAWFEPIQPVLSALALTLLGWALLRRLRAERACPVPA